MRHLDWYERVYPELTGAGIWLRGGELNTLPGEAYEERPFHVLFTRLSTYFDAAGSFTHPLLYQIAAEVPGVFPDLAYLPPRADLPIFRRDGVPWLLGTQTKRGPEDFELLGLSASVVQELVNLPSVLRESGIPLGKRERLERPDLPLILLGGASALYSAVAWGPDPWVDAVFVGESDAAIRRLLELGRDARSAGRGKRELLAELLELPGVLEPDRPRPTRRASLASLDDAAAPERAPVPYVPEQMGSGHLPISEGCPCFCNFCAESWDRKPYRERGLEALLQLALRAKTAMGLEELELHSASFNAHSSIYRLLWELVPLFGRVGLKSQRFDLLAHDPTLVEIQHALEKTSLTCGLEGISPRLRRYLQKSLPEEDLRRALDAIFRSRARELKLFLIATGLEEAEDFEALDGLLAAIAELRRRHGGRTRVICSITPLVRFPWTPLEFEDAPTLETCDPVLRRVARSARAAGFEFREAAELAEYWCSQVLVRAARPEVGRALLAAVEQTGFVYYRHLERAFHERFRACLEAEGLRPDELLRGHDLEESRAKPWALVETGVRREFLWESLQRARRFEENDYCLGRSWVRGRCAQCGACTPAEVATLVGARQERPASLEKFRERAREARRTERPVALLVSAGVAARGLPRRMLGVALARAILSADPALARGYRRYGGASLELEGRPVWIEGADILTLCFRADAVARLEECLQDETWRARVNADLGSWGELIGPAPDGWSPRELVLLSPWPFAPEAHLRSMGLKYTLRRQAEGYRLELPPASLKKGLLRRLEWHPRGNQIEVVVSAGPRLVLDDLVRRSFTLPRPEDWVRVRVRALLPAETSS